MFQKNFKKLEIFQEKKYFFQTDINQTFSIKKKTWTFLNFRNVENFQKFFQEHFGVFWWKFTPFSVYKGPDKTPSSVGSTVNTRTLHVRLGFFLMAQNENVAVSEMFGGSLPGSHGRCLICSSQCQVSPLSDKVRTFYSHMDSGFCCFHLQVSCVHVFRAAQT